MITISEISYNENDILGHGSTSTVYAGKFQSRDVAVKRVPKDKSKLIEREVDLLIKGDNHPNIVRYFMLAQDPDYQYIALERCQFTLLDYVKQGDLQTYLPKKELIWKIFQGMKRLHEIGIGKSFAAFFTFKPNHPHYCISSQRHQALKYSFT